MPGKSVEVVSEVNACGVDESMVIVNVLIMIHICTVIIILTVISLSTDRGNARKMLFTKRFTHKNFAKVYYVFQTNGCFHV